MAESKLAQWFSVSYYLVWCMLIDISELLTVYLPGEGEIWQCSGVTAGAALRDHSW